MKITSWGITPYLIVSMVKQCRQDHILLSLLYFQDMSLAPFGAWPLLSCFGFLFLSAGLFKNYIRTDKSNLTVIF